MAADLPVWDQWFALPVLAEAAAGEINWSHLAAPHNEHRVLTGRLVTLTLVGLSGYWDLAGERVVGAAARAAELGLLLVLLGPLVDGPRRLGLVVLLLCIGALPLSPFNLLSGFQVQFPLVEVASLAALTLLVTRPPAVDVLVLATLCCGLAFFSMASGLLAPAVAAGVLCLKAVAVRRLADTRLVVVVHCVGLAAAGYLLTPSLSMLEPTDAATALHTLVSCLGFPTRSWWVAGLVHAPAVLLAVQFVRQRRSDDPGWLLVAFEAWSLTVAVAMALKRGGDGRAPGEQHWEHLALALVWNYVALARLEGAWVQRFGRALAAAWVVACLGLLGGHVMNGALSTLRASHERAPALQREFQQAWRTGDWTPQRERLERAAGTGGGAFIFEAEGRYTIPPAGLEALVQSRLALARLLPPAMAPERQPALAARLLAGITAGWPALLALGGLLAAAGAWETARPHRPYSSISNPS